MKEFQKEITIRIRTTSNFTHNCIIDNTIQFIQPWRRSRHKFQLYLILHFFTLGIIHLISLFIPSLYLKLYCKRSTGLMADFFLITDKNNKQHLVKLEKLPLDNSNAAISKFYRMHFGKDEVLKVFHFHYMTYIYSDSENCVFGLYMDFTKYKHNEIHSFMTEGMDTELYKEHRKAFGKNVYESSLYFTFKYFWVVELPMNACILISAIIYFAYGNYPLGSVYIAFIIIIIVLKVLYKKSMLKRLPIDSLADSYSTLSLMMSSIKKIEKKTIRNIDIIPGDFLVLDKGRTVPCDCLLLEGDCVVNENNLFGKTSVTRKTHLPKDNKDFDYMSNKSSFLYQSSTIVKCHSSVGDTKSIIVIAVNTAGNTLRSNLYASTLINTQSDLNVLYKGKKIMLICAVIIVIACYASDFVVYHMNPLLTGRQSHLVKYVIKTLIILFFPLYHICLFFISFLCMIRMRRHNIECVDESKLEMAGRLNTIVFDKTGTLAEEVSEISGYQPVVYEGSEPILAPIDDKEPKKLKYNHLKYWKEYKKSSVSFQDVNENKTELSSINFLHCLVTCHNLEKINNEICGALLEKEMLKRMKWDLNAIKIEVNSNTSCNSSNCNESTTATLDTIEVYPKNYYKITEKAMFERTNQSNRIFKLQIYTRFMSNSSSQGISAIVKNTYNDSLSFFCKGQPEDILPQCILTTLPKDIESVLTNHRKNGYRLIACATKEINRYSIEDKEAAYMRNLTFLGFILLKNKLRKETKKVVERLRKMNMELLMATGDGVYTSLSVAYESKFISDKNIYVFDLVKDNRDSKDNNEEGGNVNDKHILITHLYQSTEEKTKRILEDSVSFSGRRLLNESSSNSDINHTINNTGNGNGNTKGPVVFLKINQFNFNPNDLDVLESMKHNSIYCLSGETFDFVYSNYKSEQKQMGKGKDKDKDKGALPYTKLIRYVKHLCKIYFFMSSDNKSDLIAFLRSFPKKIVSMVGDGANDLSAMMNSHVGISLKPRRICHFYSKSNSLECVEKIIKFGRTTRENYISLFLFHLLGLILQGILFVLIYSIGSEVFNKYEITIELIMILTASFSFQIHPDFSINSHPLYQGPYFILYSIVKLGGHIAIKLIQSMTFFFVYEYNPLLISEIISRHTFGSYLFLLSCQQVLSSVIALNIDAFSRVNKLGNDFVTFFLTILEFYIIALLTLTSWNFHGHIFNLLSFEYLKENLDSYDDQYKLLFVAIVVMDIGSTIAFAKILTYVYTLYSIKELKRLERKQLMIQANNQRKAMIKI